MELGWKILLSTVYSADVTPLDFQLLWSIGYSLSGPKLKDIINAWEGSKITNEDTKASVGWRYFLKNSRITYFLYIY